MIITDRCNSGHATIHTLSDDILLEIFYFYQMDAMQRVPQLWKWHILVHVCRRWRYIVYASPLRLCLHICCKPTTPVRTSLNVWPPLPIIIRYSPTHEEGQRGEDNIIAALEHRDRVSEIRFSELTSAVLDQFSSAMEASFPVLQFLRLESFDESVTDLPDTFLDGSAQRLQSFTLDGIGFPAIPKFLLSATHLLGLWLWRIPSTGYISPETMVNCLVGLASLKTLCMEFQSPRSRPDQRSLPPLRRAALPSLTQLSFRGVSEYLEDFVSRIDAPLLNSLHITIFNQLIFDLPHLHQFIRRAESFASLNRADIEFYGWVVKIILRSPNHHGRLEFGIRCKTSDWQVSSITQVCSQKLYPLSRVKRLCLLEVPSAISGWQEDMDPSQWLELFHPFSSVQSLYVSKKLQPFIIPVLQELVEERDPVVLPPLHSLFLEELHASGPAQEDIEAFVAARRLSGHSVDIQRWE
jgi:hypothetical protein